MAKTETLLFFLLIAIVATPQHAASNLVRFKPGVVYKYEYKARTAIEKAGVISVKAEIGIKLLEDTDRGQHCQLLIRSIVYYLHSPNAEEETLGKYNNITEFSKWFSFILSDYGEIQTVYYPENDQAWVIIVKKLLIGAYSAKLHSTEGTLSKGVPWSYRVNETGHEGGHEAIYTVKQVDQGLLFRKTKYGHVVPRANVSLDKEIFYENSLQLPHTINIREHFTAPRGDDWQRGSAGSKESSTGEGQSTKNTKDAETPRPDMHANSESTIKYIGQYTQDFYHVENELDLKEDTLKVDTFPIPRTPLSEIQMDIESNMTCMQMHQHSQREKRSGCFMNILKMVQSLSDDDVIIFGKRHIMQGSLSVNMTSKREIAIDVLGASATRIAQDLLVDLVLLSPSPNATLVSRALTHFVGLDKPPSRKSIQAIYKLAFRKIDPSEDLAEEKIVHNRAVLVLGSVAKCLRSADQGDDRQKGDQIVREMEDLLGVHDPWHQRRKRATLTPEDFRDFLEKKATLIYSLGNAVYISSFEHLFSYLNDSESHPMLRRSAVHAISRFELQEAVETLMMSALYDEDKTVRHLARIEYFRHPFVIEDDEITGMFNRNVSRAATVPRLERIRRSILTRLSFDFKLEIPGIHWTKSVGNKDIGADVGLILRNKFELEISPSEGHAEIDIYDHAYAKAHVGFFNWEYSLLDAKVCFYGKVGYNINILQEFGYEDIAELAKLFDEVVNDIIPPLKQSIVSFKEALAPDSVPITEIFRDLIDAVRDLPVQVGDFRNVSKDAVSMIGKYRGLPDSVYELQEVILRLSSLFSAVKTDAMDLYHDINEAVTVILPWAAEQIQKSLKASSDALNEMFKSPVSSIRDISRFFRLIKDVISALVKEVINKIEAALAFSDGDKPFWFDLDAQIDVIWNDLQAVANHIEIQNSKNWTARDDDAIKQLTGISEETVREQIIDDVRGLVEILAEPTDRLKSISEPFQRAYDAVYVLVETLKKEYDNLRKTYDSAKSLIDKVFGIKAAKSFPRKIAEGSCGDGFYPSEIGNTPPGIDLEIDVGNELSAPFTGTVTQSGPTQVIIELYEELPHTEIIIDHVDVSKDVLESGEVSKGLELGTVTDSGCRPNAIHLAMRRIGTEEYIDPTEYIENRDMDTSTVYWNQGCDEYLLILKNDVIAGPKPLVGGSVMSDESPERIDEPDLSDLGHFGDLKETDKEHQEIPKFSTIHTKETEDNSIETAFDLHVKQVSELSLEEALELLDDVGQTYMKEQLEDLMSQLQSCLLSHDFKRPEKMIYEELSLSSKTREVESGNSSRSMLQWQYRQPQNRCSHLWTYLPSETFCNFDIDCLGIYCDVEMDLFYFPVHFPVSIRIQNCQLITGLAGVEEIFDMIDLASEGPVEYKDVAMDGIKIFEDVILEYSLTVAMNDTDSESHLAKVMLKARICSNISDYCLSQVSIFEELTLVIDECSEILRPVEDPQDISQLSLRQFEDLFDIIGLDDSLVTELMNDMVDSIALKKVASIDIKLLDDYKNEFYRFDIKLSGFVTFGQDVKYFDVTFRFPIGFFFIHFGFGCGGPYEVMMSAEVGLLSMAPRVTVTPAISAAVSGALGMGIPFFAVEMRITGYILTISFPTQAQLLFLRFPMEFHTRVDVNLVPFKLELRTLIMIRIKILRIEKSWIIINILIWSYTTPTVSGNILNKGDLEPDDTPPSFTKVSKEKELTILNRIDTSDDVTECDVYQLPGRDYIDPAFSLEVAVGDEYSEVELTFCVGSYKSGCDVLRDQPMGGAAVVIAEMLPGGVITHFTVTATDSANNAAIATCYLPTYDVSLPEGRVTSEFQATSRHDILRASAVVYDDSELKSQKEGVGFGYGIFSDQIVPWTDVHVGGNFASVANQNDDPLTEFTRERLGRLILSPFEVASYSRVSDCASHCLNVISTTCLSFNYDFGTSGTCEILLGIEGSAAELHESGRFHYYERLGVGHSLEFYHDDLLLRHGDVYYMQLQVQNDLGYENIISSEPIIADFSPPNPGIIENELIDQISNEPCLNFVPDEWQFRCVETTELANYRIIVDGEGSACVFNGHTPYVDLLYTRANTYVSANWDGFHDDETGIYGYTWTIGTEPCLDDIHPHKDPHAHLFDESEWTHIGLADSFEEELADGKYHVSVRAINKVDFGGPMATTVCHSISYTIDRSPPIVHEVTVLGYDEDDCIITATYNLSDDLSHIREISFGLGKSPRDVYLLDWKRESNITHIAYPFCVPDGVPTWVKIRAMNHVELTTVGHAESPIIVDTSPPIPGEVFDGTVLDHDIDYQSSPDELCVSWKGFYDEESGIEKYVWYAGVNPGSNDTIESIELGHSEFRACKSGVELKHNERYYSTIVAFNAGHKKLSTAVTTDGVLVDTTPPVEGWIIDGLQREYDMIYSPVATTVSASWDDFADPESNIKEYLARIWRKKQGKGNPSQAENIYSRGSLPAETNSINWHHFHLHHGDYVYTEIEAVNKALTGTKVASTGFTVDLTEPIFNFIGDGDTLGVDRSYTESLTQLAANWDCEDHESGLDHYKVTVYQTYGGSRRQFYPSDGESHEIVDSDTVVWHSPSTLNLINGGYYSIRVSAVNGAGLGSVRDTSGVIVDSTPPQMLQISIGVLTADEEEELIDGYVMQTDTEGIRAYWEAIDFESGIMAYWIAVGTSGGATDVQDFTKYDPTNGGYIDDLVLKKYSDEENPGTLYFVTCKAENGAGTISEALVSSAIKVVSADKVGFVTDGPEVETNDEMEQMAVDIDYQKEIGTVTAQFTGFESEQHGIVHYEWAVGTTPRSDDVQPYISDGIVTDDEGYHVGEGISSSGAAQSLLSLVHGKQYFATIRAITGAGNVLDSSSDGFTVDVTAPHISIHILEGRNESDPATDSSKYQKSEQTIESSWTISEEESEILHTEFCYGSFPGSSDIFNCTDTTGIDQTPSSMVEPNVQGLPNILTLRTTNQVGLMAEAHSDGITVDTTPPTPGNISCPPSIRTTDDLICSWGNFNDMESGIAHYEVALGFAEGDDAVYPSTVVDSSFHEYKFNGPFLDVQHYVTLIVTNNAGGETRSYSNPVYVDDTPPIPGSVVHLDGVDEVDYSGSPSVKCDALKDIDCATNDAVCQKSVDRLFVAWEGFDDPESIVTRYQVAVGANPGTTDILDFADVDVSLGNFAFIDGVDLYDVRQAFVSVRGYNLAGMHTTAVSNGVYISRVSAGLPPLEGTYIWDGRQDTDVDFQDSNEMLEAQWSFQGDPCPKIHYEWAIFRFDGLAMQNFTTTTDEFGMNDGLDMKNEESYYSVVKASNLLGYTEVIRSDGITIQLEPLLPRDVRDGDVYGIDLNFQDSITSLSANWETFGDQCGWSYAQGEETSTSQTIDHYELAMGTDNRYPDTREDIQSFVDIGCNVSYTFDNLQLVPRTQTYYATVRAYSVSSSMTEVTSNGIKVGYGGEVVSEGEITLQRYISSVDKVSLSWAGFEFGMPVMFYTWGITGMKDSPLNVSCFDLQNFHETDEGGTDGENEDLFDIHPWTNVGKDTIVEATGLSLADKETYRAVVMATDESGFCSLALADFTVDLTPPVPGHIRVGPFTDEAVTYITRGDMLPVAWSDFYDDESGLDKYSLSLHDGLSCDGKTEPVLLIDFIDVPANDTSYTFVDLDLETNRPYNVHLRVTNTAGLSTTVVSQPVFVDLTDPTAGVVKDTDDFRTDNDYQSSKTSLDGFFLHLPTSEGAPCPSRVVSDDFTADGGWFVVNSQGVWGTEYEDTVMFTPNQVSTGNANDELLITMTRDVTMDRMLSGAYYQGRTDIFSGGKYSIDIKAASGNLSSITSIVFWDGPDGVAGDFEVPFLAEDWLDEERKYDDCGMCCNQKKELADEDINCLCNCTEYFENLEPTTAMPSTTTSMSTTGVHTTPVPWDVVQDDDPDDSFEGDIELKSIVYQSMGIQIYPGAEKNGEVKHFVGLWFRYYNNSEPEMYDIAELDFDPSEAWHSYVLEVSASQNEMTLELFVDGTALSFMVGLEPFSMDPKFILSVWNAEGKISPFDDVFYLPESTAYFRNIRFPPSADAMCRFGDPFRSGDNPIVAYFAGVGSEHLLDDVVPFYEVYRPCIPCSNQCLGEACDSECSQRATTEYHVKMTDLALNTTRTIEEDGETESVPAVYYFTVKAVTGSGRYALASSDGIYIDDTPPVFDYLYHVDLSWSEDEPVTYQGCNSTIAVRWDVYDIGSQVEECKWAIGTWPNATDIQEFVSVGLDNFVWNDELLGLLEDGKTYYVTVWSINSAGLVTVKSTSGVAMVLSPPDVTESNTTSLCGDSDAPPSGLCGDQSSTGLTWTAVDDVSVHAYYYSIGSSEGMEDIFPKTQVGFNESGTVTVKDGAIYVEDEPISNISDIREAAEKTGGADLDDDTVYEDRFHMEPGRTLVSRITVCTKGHLCEDMQSSKTTITRAEDHLLKAEDGLQIDKSGVKTLHKHGDSVKSAGFKENGETGENVIVGLLNHDDVTDEYVSDASTSFTPYIVDPETTMDDTDRYLHRRIRSIVGPTFYVTTIGGTPLTEPFDLSVGYDSSSFVSDSGGTEPAIVYWDSEMHQWKDVSHTCSESFGEYKHDQENSLLTVQVCATTSVSESYTERRRRDVNQGFFSGPTEFTLAIIGPFSNSPPVFTSASNLWMWEDGGTLRYQLTAFDADDDVIKFNLDPASPHSAESVKVSADGEFTYRPCLDCYGVDYVTVIAREDRDDDFEELSTVSTIEMDIRGVNDNPELLFSVNHRSVLNNDHNAPTTTTAEQRHADDDFYLGLEAVVGAFDPDTSDVLTLTFDPPEHGELIIGSQHTQVTFIDGDCSGPMNITDEHLSVETPDVPIVVFPCGLMIPHQRDRLAWVFSALEYTPFVDFTGKDSFKINAIDQDGAYSQVAVIDVFVLVNPCVNGGICTGPEHDPDCSSTERTSGFDGYSCSCPPGFTGSLCETELSLCYSNPCPYNYTCVDLGEAHSCHCENVNWPCSGATSASYTALIGVVFVVIILIAVTIIGCRRLHQKKKKMTVVAPEQIETTCQPVLGETEMKNLTTRSPSPAQNEQHSRYDDRRELETEDTAIASDVQEDNCESEEEDIDETIVLEATNPTEETQVDKNDGKVEETAMMGTSLTQVSGVTGTNNNNMIHHQGEKLKVAPVTLERFGFVNRPFAPRAAWALAGNDEQPVTLNDLETEA